MTISPSKPPILLIEDNLVHAEQITALLSPRYAMDTLSSLQPRRLYNYKTLNQDSQVLIVDLNLNASKDFDAEEGLKLIREKLWPVDRTAFFVVFSVHIDERTVSRLVKLNTLDPHCAFVSKRIENGRLTDECLTELSQVVDKCIELSSPVLETPAFDSYHWIEPLNAYLTYLGDRSNEHHQAVKENIAESTKLLNSMSQAAAFYAKAGESARALAIGVYGSYGRLERRRDSDVEFSIYYDDKRTPPIRKLTVTVWNRMMSYLTAQGIRFEGEDDIKENEDGLLDISQINVDLPNGYCFVIPCSRLITTELTKEPHVRNRHFQTFTELRAIFNPDFVAELKRQILYTHVAKNITDVWTIVGSAYFREISDQFLVDAKPRALNNWSDLKKFCYRTLQILALRFALIRQLTFGPQRIAVSDQWNVFFDGLADPGIVKLVRFANELISLRDNKFNPLTAELNKLIQAYFLLLSRFSMLSDDSQDHVERDVMANELRSLVRQILEHFLSVVGLIKELATFDAIHNVPWLLSTEKFVDMKNEL